MDNPYTSIQEAFNSNYVKLNQIKFIIEEIASRMVNRLDYIKIKPNIILDIGYGLGVDYQLLKSKYPKAHVYAIDSSINVLKHYSKITDRKFLKKLFSKANNHFICADMNLPFNSQSIDLLWSNLTIPYITNEAELRKYLLDMNRVLKLGGTFLISGLGVDSLKEIRELGLNTYNFPDMHLIGDILVEVGFSNSVTDVDIIKLEYNNLDELLADMEFIGYEASPNDLNKADDDNLISKFDRMAEGGKFYVTLEVFYAHAWKEKIRKDLVSGRSVINFFP